MSEDNRRSQRLRAAIAARLQVFGDYPAAASRALIRFVLHGASA